MTFAGMDLDRVPFKFRAAHERVCLLTTGTRPETEDDYNIAVAEDRAHEVVPPVWREKEHLHTLLNVLVYADNADKEAYQQKVDNLKDAEKEAFCADRHTRQLDDITSDLTRGFLGWHFATKEGICRTAFAAVPSSCAWATSLKGNQSLNDGSHMSKYAAALHNGGTTLQSRQESMALTRDVKVLVRGPSPVCHPTVCALHGSVRFTDAHSIVASHALCSLFDEAERLISKPGTVHHYLRSKQSILRKTPTIAAFYADTELQKVPVSAVVVLVQATAVLFTGYADAGRNFRDRSSRHEGARHVGEAIRAILCICL